MAEHAVLAGRYRLIESVGRGGMAQVWSAEDTALNRLVAVKLLNPSSAAAPPAMRDGTAGYVLLTAEKATAP